MIDPRGNHGHTTSKKVKVVLSDELLPALSVAVIETVYVPEGMPDDGKVH